MSEIRWPITRYSGAEFIEFFLTYCWQLVAWRVLRRRGDPPQRIQLAFDREQVRQIRLWIRQQARNS